MAYDVSRIQKRTRDKEYRLRKQGANDAAIAGVSPRKSWAEVKAMTPSQQQAYAKRLDNWNKSAKYTGVSSGNVIPTKLINQGIKLQRERNKFIAHERQRIAGIAPSEWQQYYAPREGILGKGEQGIMGLLAPIPIEKMEPPTNVEVARRRIKRFEQRNKRSFDWYRKRQRKSMKEMLWKLDQYELAEIVYNMSDDAFDLLATVYPSWEHIEMEYHPRGERISTEDPYAGFRGYVERALSVTQGKSIVGVQKELEESSKKNAKRGSKRARDTMRKRLQRKAK